MPILIGIFLAVAIGFISHVTGFDRRRFFYPLVLIVIALLYDLFAAFGGGSRALISESGPGAGFLVLAWLGYRYSPWFIVAGLAGHGIFDLFHPHLIVNAGVPIWWPAFCGAYDVTAAVFFSRDLGKIAARSRLIGVIDRSERRMSGGAYLLAVELDRDLVPLPDGLPPSH